MDRVKECFLEIERLQRLLVEGEARVVRQEGFIVKMKQQGLDTTEAEKLLAVFKRTLEAMPNVCLRASGRPATAAVGARSLRNSMRPCLTRETPSKSSTRRANCANWRRMIFTGRSRAARRRRQATSPAGVRR